MEKINKIVKSLSEDEYQTLLATISTNHADKSAQLLNFTRTKDFSDRECIKELDIKANAFYTLKSRLSQKVYNFLVSRMEAPKLDLIKKVAFTGEIMFSTEREVVIATLRRLEKQLSDYDLPYELIKIYQNLKKININNPEAYYNYSQLYNKHVAYTLALDRADDMVGNYFNIYRKYFFSRDEMELIQLNIVHKELISMCELYESHRLYIFSSLVGIFSILFVPDKFDRPEGSMGDIEDIFKEVDEIFLRYENDPFYFHLSKVFDYLKMEYYHRLGLVKKEMEYFDLLSNTMPEFLKYLGYYMFTPKLLLSKLELYKNQGMNHLLQVENIELLEMLNVEKKEVHLYIVVKIYEAISHIYSGQYESSVRVLNQLRGDVSYKYMPHIEMEIKTITAIAYSLLGESDLCNQLIKSIQRQVRNMEEETGREDLFEDTKYMMKILTKMINYKENKQIDKVKLLLEKFEQHNKGEHCIIPYFDSSILLKGYNSL